MLETVAYASLFDYPLTLGQLRACLIGADADEASLLACYASSAWVQAVVEHADGFFFLRGRRGLVAKRRAREARSRALLARHRSVLRLVCALPFVRLVALSGSAAHENVGPEGDLDLFVVTRGRCVWAVTLALVALTRWLGCREVVCANYVVSDRALAVEQPDLFSANQILHLRVLAGEELFGALMAANPFVAAHYPGWRHVPRTLPGYRPGLAGRCAKRLAELALACGPVQVAEMVARVVYRRHLAARAAAWASPEQVRLEREHLKLHTASHRRTILERFAAEVTRLRADADAIVAAARAADPDLTGGASEPARLSLRLVSGPRVPSWEAQARSRTTTGSSSASSCPTGVLPQLPRRSRRRRPLART